MKNENENKMAWTVCDFRDVKIIKKNTNDPEFDIYLQKASAGNFICGGGGIDAIIKIGDENYLVCEIKRKPEDPLSWLTSDNPNDYLKNVRNHWREELYIKIKASYPNFFDKCNEPTRERLNQAKEFLEKSFATKPITTEEVTEGSWKEFIVPFAWAITIGGQLEKSFLDIEKCKLEGIPPNYKPFSFNGKKKKDVRDNAKRCLIFHKDSAEDVKNAFGLLFDKVKWNLEEYIPKTGLEDVCIYAFEKLEKDDNNVLIKYGEGWYTKPKTKAKSTKESV